MPVPAEVIQREWARERVQRMRRCRGAHETHLHQRVAEEPAWHEWTDGEIENCLHYLSDPAREAVRQELTWDTQMEKVKPYL